MGRIAHDLEDLKAIEVGMDMRQTREKPFRGDRAVGSPPQSHAVSLMQPVPFIAPQAGKIKRL